MKDIKCPTASILRVRDMPLTPIERALSVPSYSVLNSKNIIFELCRS